MVVVGQSLLGVRIPGDVRLAGRLTDATKLIGVWKRYVELARSQREKSALDRLREGVVLTNGRVFHNGQWNYMMKTGVLHTHV